MTKAEMLEFLQEIADFKPHLFKIPATATIAAVTEFVPSDYGQTEEPIE